MGKQGSLDKGVIELVGPHVTEAMLATLRQHYELLHIESGEKAILDVRDMSPEDQERVTLDVDFHSTNPNLPLENLCSRLDNYDPKNSSQEELLRYARQLVEFPDFGKPAGIYAHGDAGVGKTHIAVALAKEFMKRGYQPNFRQFSTRGAINSPKLGPQQVWLLDDLNSPYGLERDIFTEITLNAHNTGGRLFVTSNMDYDAFMDKLPRLMGEASAKRYLDRIQSLFKVIRVVGESNREQTAWYTE